MSEFRRAAVEQYANDLAVHLRRSFPHRTAQYKEDELHQLVRSGIERASRYKIDLTLDVRRFVEFMVLIAPEFDESPATPWARQVLTDETLNSGPKLDRVEGYAAAFGVLQPAV
jgi:hypothetical protein